MRERTEERILCVLKSPDGAGAFGIRVYAVGGDKPRCILEAASPRSEVLGFLGLMQEGARASGDLEVLSADS